MSNPAALEQIKIQGGIPAKMPAASSGGNLDKKFDALENLVRTLESNDLKKGRQIAKNDESIAVLQASIDKISGGLLNMPDLDSGDIDTNSLMLQISMMKGEVQGKVDKVTLDEYIENAHETEVDIRD